MTPLLWDRVRDLLNRRILGDESADDLLLDAWHERTPEWDTFFIELGRQLEAEDTYIEWRYPECVPLLRAWSAYRKEGVPNPPWSAVVARSKVQCSARQLRRCRIEIGADHLPKRARGRPRKKIGRKIV